jgi:hypothetical protein
MAKKSRRARRRAQQAVRPVRLARPSRPLAGDAAPKEVEFAKEYHYVVEDLKRIAIIAAALLVLLIVLTLVIG